MPGVIREVVYSRIGIVFEPMPTEMKGAVELSIGRKPEVDWERKPPEAVMGEVEPMDQDSKTSTFAGLSPGNRPLASGEPVPVYVSYAWDDPTIAWVDELERTLPASMRLMRDKNEVPPRGWISTFMQDIGRAQHVVVVLSTKYLQSQYCMRELLYLHDRSLGDRADLMGRIVPVVMEDLKIADGVGGLAHAIHWQERHDALNAMANKAGIAAAGGAARDELLAMKTADAAGSVRVTPMAQQVVCQSLCAPFRGSNGSDMLRAGHSRIGHVDILGAPSTAAVRLECSWLF